MALNVSTSFPSVSIIIVNYNGITFLPECLDALFSIDFPTKQYEVILVDNASSDGSAEFVQKKYPQVTLVRARTNTGFTGGNILGYEKARGKYIVLLNSDTRVDKLWLTELVKCAESKPKGAIFTSKLRFYTPFLPIQLKVPALQRSEIENSIDFSPIGLLLEEVNCGSEALNQLVWYKSGFYDKGEGEVPTRWTKGNAELLLPFPWEKLNQEKEYTFRLTVHGLPSNQEKSTTFQVYLGSTLLGEEHVASQAVKQFSFVVTAEEAKRHLIWCIQNAGNIILHDGYSKDRGSLLEVRNGQMWEFYDPESDIYNKQMKLLSGCGASCLIKREAIKDVGFLDPHFFMYYEDVELSLRAWRTGWDIWYVPTSMVYHRHRATTKNETTAFFLHFTERNHLFLTFLHFPLSIFLQQFSVFALRLGMNGSKMLIFYFSEDLLRYERWRTQFKGRQKALADLVKHFSVLCKQKWFWKKREKRSFLQMRRMMY